MRTPSCARIAPANCIARTSLPRGQFDWIKENLAAELHVTPQLSTYYYGFNLDRALFAKHPQLRQALSMAIDRERLANSVLRMGELPAYGWVPPGMYNYTAQSFDYAAMPMAERIDDRAQAAGRGGLHARKAAALRAALQHRRSSHQGGRGGGVDVEGSAGRRSAARGGGVQIAVRGHRPPQHRHVSTVLGRRLQRSVHLPAVPQGRLRHQSAALLERRLRRAARRSVAADRRREAPRAARTGGTHRCSRIIR